MAILLIIILSATVSLVYLNLVYNYKVNKTIHYVHELFDNMHHYAVINSTRIRNIDLAVEEIKTKFDVEKLAYEDELIYLTKLQCMLERNINTLEDIIKAIKDGLVEPITGDNTDIMKKQLRYMKSYNSALKERINSITSARTYTKDIVKVYSY